MFTHAVLKRLRMVTYFLPPRLRSLDDFRGFTCGFEVMQVVGVGLTNGEGTSMTVDTKLLLSIFMMRSTQSLGL